MISNRQNRHEDEKSDVKKSRLEEEHDLEKMVGRHREEFSDDRKPATYHFSSEQLQHKEDPIDPVSETQ